MSKLWFCLNDKSRRILQQIAGKGWDPPQKYDRGIEIETKPESLDEMASIMEEAPNYTITGQGRSEK